MNIRVDDVRSGSDELGRGELGVSLVDGRIDVDPLRLESELGRLELQSSVKPGQAASDAALRLEIEDFDLGALLRLSDPDSRIGGEVNVAIDVTSS
ncbi:MAG: hypothetical protein AAGE01_25980, partial [Pseudomonadota bacterium]